MVFNDILVNNQSKHFLEETVKDWSETDEKTTFGYEVSIFHYQSGKVHRQRYLVANRKDERELSKTQAVAAHVLLMSCSYE